MNPVLDMTLSFEARGVVAYLLAAQHADTTVTAVRALGLGRDTAYRVCYELELRGIFLKSGKSSYNFLISGSSTAEPAISSEFVAELPNFLISGNQEDRATLIRDSKELISTVAESAELPEIRKPVQALLIGCPEPPPPVAATPSPKSPSKPRKENPPEAKALYPAIFELCKSGTKGDKGQACRMLAKHLAAEFAATPEQVEAFWDWFKVFSQAASIAARERRPVNAPMPKQVYADWRQFLVWWEARQAQAARAAEDRRRAEEAAAAAPPPPPSDAPRLSGRELYRRTFSLPRPDGPVLTAD
jgi:predicted transcriptional regulator